MIQRQDIFNINFYKKERFHGSYKGMHYLIEKFSPDEDETVLRVTVWPGPYNFDTTPNEKKTCTSFPFTEDGLTQVCEYLNEFHQSHYPNRTKISTLQHLSVVSLINHANSLVYCLIHISHNGENECDSILVLRVLIQILSLTVSFLYRCTFGLLYEFFPSVHLIFYSPCFATLRSHPYESQISHFQSYHLSDLRMYDRKIRHPVLHPHDSAIFLIFLFVRIPTQYTKHFCLTENRRISCYTKKQLIRPKYKADKL